MISFLCRKKYDEKNSKQKINEQQIFPKNRRENI